MSAAVMSMPEQREPGERLSAVLSLAVHAGLALFLIYGITWQKATTDAVEVELVRSVPAQTPPPQPLPEVKPEPVPEPAAKVKPAEIKPDIVLKDRKEKKKPEARPAPTPPETDSRLEKMLKSEAEQFSRNQASDRLERELGKARANSAALAWADKIRAKIKGNLRRPGNISGNPEAVYVIHLLPDGSLVGDPGLKRSTGNPALDAAIERAIRASSPLPQPDNPAAFQRELELTFRPMED